MSLICVDDKGKTIKQILNRETIIAGKHQLEIETHNFKPGNYWLKFRTSTFTESEKVVIE